MYNKPFWNLGDKKAEPALKGNEKTDILIIGGGITGMSAAYHLSRIGADFTLLEADKVACFASGRNSGSLIAGAEADFYESLKMYGTEQALAIYRATLESIITISKLPNAAKEFDFTQTKPLYLAKTKEDMKIMEKEYWATNRHEFETRLLDSKDTERKMGNKLFCGALEYRYGAAVNPYQLIQYLKARTTEGKIFENSKVVKLTKSKGGITAKTRQGEITARKLLVCTESFSPQFKLISMRGCTINSASALVTKRIPKRVTDLHAFGENKIAWTTGQDYTFVRSVGEDRLLVSMSYKKLNKPGSPVPKPIIAMHKKRLLETFPQIRRADMEYAWSCQMIGHKDLLPAIGKNPKNPNILHSMLYSGHGMPFGFLGGKMLSEMASETESEATKYLAKLFNPGRL
jgi:glycine/D-amino acid oxidase-like deaminating enzyme